jgi:5-formyltetrahydrofolate cyclo-ligase
MTSKPDLRAAMRVRRALVSEAARATAAADLARHGAELADLTTISATRIVSGYLAIGDELDPGPLLALLALRGAQICMPMMIGRHNPLAFRRYSPGDALEDRMWGIKEPLGTAELVTPSVLLVPLLAFDADGWRLGYGGGFYDRTLHGLRSAGLTIAVGLGFDEQEVGAVPHDAADQPLDFILTPRGLRRTNASRRSTT